MKKAIVHLKKSDSILAAIIERAGAYKIHYREPGFETLVRSITNQQLNGTAAATILAKAVLMAGSWRLATISRESTRRSAPRFRSALPGEEWMDGS